MRTTMWAILAALALAACGEDPTATGQISEMLDDKQLSQAAPGSDFETASLALNASCWSDGGCASVHQSFLASAVGRCVIGTSTYQCYNNECRVNFPNGNGLSLTCINMSGQCTSSSQCAWNQQCVDYRCVANNQQGWSCNDGDPCTQNDQYNWQGQCVGSRITCDDGRSCTTDSCSNGTCTYTNNCSWGTCNSAGTCDGGWSSWGYLNRIRFELRYPSSWTLTSVDVEGQFCSSGNPPWDCYAADNDYWGRWWLAPSYYNDGWNKVARMTLDVYSGAKRDTGYLRFTMPITGYGGFSATNVFNTPTGWNGLGGTPQFFNAETGAPLTVYAYPGSGGGAIGVIKMRQ